MVIYLSTSNYSKKRIQGVDAIECDKSEKVLLRLCLKAGSKDEGIRGGYHMNKKHWNTLTLEASDVDEETVDDEPF